jgi:hypothetical protein
MERFLVREAPIIASLARPQAAFRGPRRTPAIQAVADATTGAGSNHVQCR